MRQTARTGAAFTQDEVRRCVRDLTLLRERHFPTVDQIHRLGPPGLVAAMTRIDSGIGRGVANWARRFGYTEMRRTGRNTRHWKPEFAPPAPPPAPTSPYPDRAAVDAALARLMVGREYFPAPRELVAAGHGELLRAIRNKGGRRYWRYRHPGLAVRRAHDQVRAWQSTEHEVWCEIFKGGTTYGWTGNVRNGAELTDRLRELDGYHTVSFYGADFIIKSWVRPTFAPAPFKTMPDDVRDLAVAIVDLAANDARRHDVVRGGGSGTATERRARQLKWEWLRLDVDEPYEGASPVYMLIPDESIADIVRRH